jgi:hypothetical protein
VLPLVYAANRPFGFHGTVVDLEGNGYASLLTQDAKENLRLIVNDRGHFAEAHVALLAEGKSAGMRPSGAAPLPTFAWLGAVRLERPSKVQLLGLTMDGSVMVFEKQSPAERKSKSSAEKSGK